MGKRNPGIKKLVLGATALAAVSTAGVYWKSRMPVPAYTVARVIDGDTFETSEKQLIRLAEADAPEINLCGGPEAKVKLEKLVMGQPIYLKVMYRDQFMRLLSLVYTPEGFVNEKMVETGNAVYRLDWIKTSETKKLEAAQAKAIYGNIGIYGMECNQKTNTRNPKCNIKGNMREGKNTRIYSLPGCESYIRTKVQLYLGDRWFCTETEAKKAGFTKAGGCN